MLNLQPGAIVLMYKNEDETFSPVLVDTTTQSVLDLALRTPNQDKPIQVVENVKYMKQ